MTPIDFQSGSHAKLSPSSAERWFECPGSIALIATLPPEAFKTSKYAAEGTVAHSLAEQLVSGAVDFLTLTSKVGESVMQDGHEVEITDSMIEGVVEYCEAITEARKRLNRPIAVVSAAEMRVHAKSLDTDLWGTADYVLYQKGHELHVFDFKYGKGTVEAEENPQGLIYLIGAQDSGAGTAFSKAFFHIIQPRAKHSDGTVRSWELPRGRLEAFRLELEARIKAVRAPGAPRVAGTWCKFCPALGYCPEAAGSVQKAAQTAFTKIPGPPSKEVGAMSLPPVETLTSEQIARALDWEDSIDSWFEAIRERALSELSKDPNAVLGYKIVEGRSLRQWIDEVEVKSAFALLGDKLYAPRKILSPAQLEKVVGKEEVARWVVKPQGKPTVAKVSDKREMIAPSEQASQVFDALVQEPKDIFGDLMGPKEPLWPE